MPDSLSLSPHTHSVAATLLLVLALWLAVGVLVATVIRFYVRTDRRWRERITLTEE